MAELSLKSICNDKFSGVVISIFETYQLLREEHQDRLMVLVHRNNAVALFSCALNRYPPESFVDVAVAQLFAIDGNFRVEPIPTALQFKITTAVDSAMYYYYPYSTHCSTTFEAFLGDIRAAELSYQENAQSLDFAWLEPYRRVDQTAINPSIADGRTLLTERESKFQEELERRKDEYMNYLPLNIYVATWNVNGQAPGDIRLNEWLNAIGGVPDIYAIAFQELDLSAKAFTVSETKPDAVWIQRIMEGLHPGAVYEVLESARLVGMQLTVVVRREVRRHVSRVAVSSVGTGALNMMGNKGAVGVSLEINETRICFVNSHFAAHVSEVQRRKEDHDEILRRMQFEFGITRRFIYEHEHIFWFGDLNYRITEPPQLDAVTFRRQFNSPNAYETVRYLDQMYNEQQKGRVFVDFVEGPIQFRPTYKYDPGTDHWDSSEKCRAPAWCDRVLWKSQRTTQLAYASVMELQLSDHKPVYSVFVTQVKTRDEVRYKQVHEDVLKTLDKYENDNQPQITVPEKDIDFGEIRFGERVVREIAVGNNCHLPATFRFMSKEGRGSPICESWLSIEPNGGRLLTGDSVTVRLEVFVDAASVWRLHRKQRESAVKMPLDILVLHVDNGHDIFISVIGEYRPSCIGFNMETLCKLEQPIEQMNLRDVLALERRLTDNPEHTASIPRELWSLTDYLYAMPKGLATVNLFTGERFYSRNPHIVEIRDWMDSWSTGECPGTPHTAAEMIVMLLEASPVPLIHPFEEAALTANSLDDCLQVVNSLVMTRKQVFIYVVQFLREVLRYKDQNRLNVNRIARIFAPALLRSRTQGRINSGSREEQDERRIRFLSRLLETNAFSKTIFNLAERSMPLVDIS